MALRSKAIDQFAEKVKEAPNSLEILKLARDQLIKSLKENMSLHAYWQQFFGYVMILIVTWQCFYIKQQLHLDFFEVITLLYTDLVTASSKVTSVSQILAVPFHPVWKYAGSVLFAVWQFLESAYIQLSGLKTSAPIIKRIAKATDWIFWLEMVFWLRDIAMAIPDSEIELSLVFLQKVVNTIINLKTNFPIPLPSLFYVLRMLHLQYFNNQKSVQLKRIYDAEASVQEIEKLQENAKKGNGKSKVDDVLDGLEKKTSKEKEGEDKKTK